MVASLTRTIIKPLASATDLTAAVTSSQRDMTISFLSKGKTGDYSPVLYYPFVPNADKHFLHTALSLNLVTSLASPQNMQAG